MILHDSLMVVWTPACLESHPRLRRWRKSEPRFASTSPRPWKRPIVSGFIIFHSLLWWVATCNPLKSDENPNSHQSFLFGVHGSTSRPGMANTLESPWSLEGTSWTSTASSSALWPQSPPWRRLRRSTLWCFWWMSRPPNPKSRKLWSSSTMWSAPRSTPSSALMGTLVDSNRSFKMVRSVPDLVTYIWVPTCQGVHAQGSKQCVYEKYIM